LIFIQGGIVGAAASFLLQLRSQSSAEAEYVITGHTMLAGSFIQKLHLESLGINPDQPSTIPIGIDSSSPIAMSESNRDIKLT
jgi:hypothetical protein